MKEMPHLREGSTWRSLRTLQCLTRNRTASSRSSNSNSANAPLATCRHCPAQLSAHHSRALSPISSAQASGGIGSEIRAAASNGRGECWARRSRTRDENVEMFITYLAHKNSMFRSWRDQGDGIRCRIANNRPRPLVLRRRLGTRCLRDGRPFLSNKDICLRQPHP